MRDEIVKDEIIEELWKAKDDIARECGYDLNKLAELLRKRQAQGKHKVVDCTSQYLHQRWRLVT